MQKVLHGYKTVKRKICNNGMLRKGGTKMEKGQNTKQWYKLRAKQEIPSV